MTMLMLLLLLLVDLKQTLLRVCASMSYERMNAGNLNVIEAALAKGVKKFILVTSIGCGDSKDAPGDQVGVLLLVVVVWCFGEKERECVWSHALTPRTLWDVVG